MSKISIVKSKLCAFWNKRVKAKDKSSNVNEVVKAVLNSLLFILDEKILHAPKALKAPKAPKVPRRNQAKAQNAASEQ